jgi:hypothetical protein
VAEALEHGDNGSACSRKERVVIAGDEEGDMHCDLNTSVLWGGRPRPRPTSSSACSMTLQANKPDGDVRRGSGDPPHDSVHIWEN